MSRIAAVAGLLVCLPWNARGQQVFEANATAVPLQQSHAGPVSAAPEARYYRLICLVHMMGTGKQSDPIRPEFVPTATTAARDGILAWSVQMTDDNKMAIVHLVAANKKAFDPILNDKRSEMRVFEIGKHGKAEIEGELKKYRKDFDLTKFQVFAR